MIDLLTSLFPNSQVKSIIKLWQDENSKSLIQKEVGKRLLSSDKVITNFPFGQILVITSLSTFASSEDEKQSVAHIIHWGIFRNDILPLCTEHQGKELAYRCLISLGFFKRALEERCERHGAPSPDFYRELGIHVFHGLQMTEISEHFSKWEYFINEIFD